MARTYLSGDNSRGTEVTAAGGDHAHFRGWNAGVRVEHRISDAGQDTFKVIMTGGSHDNRAGVVLGTVTDTEDGPQWSPHPMAVPAEDAPWGFS